MSTFINQEQLLATLQKQLNAEMIAAAEPVIQKALKEVEDAMRKRLAEMVVGLVKQSYSVNRCGTDLHIVVHMVGEKEKS